MRVKNGFSIIELIVATAVFVLFISSSTALIFSGEDLARANQISFKALLYTQEGLEALRAIRDGSWESLAEGDYGLIQEAGGWALTGESEVLEDKYRRQITLISINQNKFKALSRVSWFNNWGQEKEVEFSTYLTNWQRIRESSAGEVDLGDSARDVYVSGNYTYLAVDDQHKSLAVVDTTLPLDGQLAASLDLNGKGRDVWVAGSYAYVALDNNKVAVVDVSVPGNPAQVASINISSHPTSVYVFNSYLYIGQDKKNEGLVIYNVANPRSPRFYRSYNMGLEVYDVKVVNGWIYMAVNAGRGFDVKDMGSYAYAYVAVDSENGGFETYYLWTNVIIHQATLNIGSPASNAFVSANRAYVAASKGDAGLVRVNISSVTNPLFLDATDIRGEGNGVFYKEGYAYMAVESTDGGLRVVEIE